MPALFGEFGATLSFMTVHIRKIREDEARLFLEVHHAAVRGLAADDYSPAVIDDWAPLPIKARNIENFRRNADSEIRLVAEMKGEIVGIGALVLANSELRACYVAPDAARKGVGTALVREIEAIARQNGLAELTLDSSVTAEQFYRALGYSIRAHTEHVLRSGQTMACVKMAKSLKHP